MSCATDNVDQVGSTSTEAAVMRKFVNTPEKAVQGELIIYVDDATARQLETSEAATRSGVTALDAVAVELGAEQLKPVFNLMVNADRKRELGMHRWYTLSFSEDANLEAAATALASLDEVERVQFSTRVEVPKTEAHEVDPSLFALTRSADMPYDDPMLQEQWHYNNDGTVDYPNAKAGADVNLFEAWTLTTGRPDVIVAIVDEGVCHEHVDLNPNMHVNEAEANGTTGVDDDENGYVDDIYGYNFVNGGKITWTRSGDSGHGTHVAGTVAAVNNNGVGVCGVAGGSGNGDGVRIMSIQAFEADTGATTSGFVDGVKYAADNGAVIINNSWGYEPGSFIGDNDYEYWDSALKDAFAYFKQTARLEGIMEGGLVVFAAGNETYNESAYPAAYREFISVSAMSSDYTATYYTNYGPGVNVCAPGGDACYGTLLTISSVSTTELDGYEYMQGTSMACPHVSGCAALAVSYAAKMGYTLTADELHRLILTSVHDINAYQTGTKSTYYASTGWGYMNLAPYKGKLGSGYIDAHLLLMQMDSTPCLYLSTNEDAKFSLNEFFGDGSKDLKYQGCSASNDVRTELGIENFKIENGMLCIKATKPGSGRINVRAIVGGNAVGGTNIGGSYVDREIEVVVRGRVAENGAWL